MQGSGGKHPCAQAVTGTVPYVVINRTFESVVYDCLRSANLIQFRVLATGLGPMVIL